MEEYNPMYDEPGAEPSVPTIGADDIVIAVMGMTGVGKSTFVSYFSESAVIGEGLVSCTNAVGIHEGRIGDRKFFLLDTPGFDDTYRSDTEVLREVADWLNSAHKGEIRLSGIVYLQRISDPRVSGSSLKNLRMFKKLCGSKSLSSVVLATTMWSSVPRDVGEKREAELQAKPEFWGRMIEQGSKIMRHDRDTESAIDIIQYILSMDTRAVLGIQTEMADGKNLDQTSAGQELEAQLQRMQNEHQLELNNLRREMEDAQLQKDREAQEEIEAIRLELMKKMQRDKLDREQMRVSMKELRRQRDEEMKEKKRVQMANVDAKRLQMANEEIARLRSRSLIARVLNM